MISYGKLLEQNNIKNVDYIEEDGHFYREYKPLDENITVGYNGYVSYDEDGEHILCTRLQYLGYEKWLDDTILYNSEFNKVLIIKNINGIDTEVELSINENRDVLELYEEYTCNPDLFERKQHILMSLYELDISMKNLNKKREKYNKYLEDINKSFQNIKENNTKTRKKIN